MADRRVEPRMLCADLVEVHWRDKSRRSRKAVANLEDISPTGACLQMDEAVPSGARVMVRYPKGELSGVVRYCHFREIGYFVGVVFEPGCKWSRSRFRPMHLLDPRTLLLRTKLLPKRSIQ